MTSTTEMIISKNHDTSLLGDTNCHPSALIGVCPRASESAGVFSKVDENGRPEGSELAVHGRADSGVERCEKLRRAPGRVTRRNALLACEPVEMPWGASLFASARIPQPAYAPSKPAMYETSGTLFSVETHLPERDTGFSRSG